MTETWRRLDCAEAVTSPRLWCNWFSWLRCFSSSAIASLRMDSNPGPIVALPSLWTLAVLIGGSAQLRGRHGRIRAPHVAGLDQLGLPLVRLFIVRCGAKPG